MEQVRKNFDLGKEQAKRLGFIPVSPLDLPHNHDGSWESYMKEDLQQLLQCKFLYALPNWEESKGARIEIELATTLGIHVIMEPVPAIREPKF